MTHAREKIKQKQNVERERSIKADLACKLNKRKTTTYSYLETENGCQSETVSTHSNIRTHARTSAHAH